MAKSNESPIHTVIRVELIPGCDPAEVSIFSDTPEELLDTVARLTGRGPVQTQQAQSVPTQPAAQAAGGPVAGAAQPQTAPAATATPTAQPSPSAAGAAQAQAAGPSAGATGTPLTAQDVLPDARELLQTQGEGKLMEILQLNGQQSISTADPAAFPSILHGIRQALGKA